jgi:dienelactone hydrolase
MDPNVGLLKQMESFEEAPAPEGLTTTVEQGDTIHVAGTHGFATFADTFGLDMCGADTFTPEDYFGHYRVGRRRFVSVIDGREEHGGFLFYDSESGMFRRLHRVSKVIFTYGPSFSADEPVAGSVTILPHKDRYDDINASKPNQIIWLPSEPPMRYGELIRFEEREVNIESGGVELPGTLIMRPEGHDVPGVVLTFCTGCVPHDKMRGFAEALALHGLAVLAYDVRTCGGVLPGGEEGLRLLASDALAAVRFLRAQPGVRADRVGVWGMDIGAQVAVAAASMGMEVDFLVAAYSPGGPAARVAATPPPRAGGVLVPGLWMFTGAEPEAFWDLHLEAVRRGKAMGRDFTVVVLPDLPEDKDPDLGRVKPLSLRFGFEAEKWIRGLR